MRKPIFLVLWFASVVAAGAVVQDSGTPADVQEALDHFSKAAFRANMAFLADDLLEGRGTGTRGQELAAKYVAAQFEAFGLQPAGVKGSYFQPVPFREITVDPEATEVSLVRDGKSTRLKWGEDFLGRGSALQPDASVEAPIVFVGFGVVNSARHYDDYAGVDVKGKVVAMLSGGPASFPANERAHFASGLQKAREAASRGAVGIITLWTPEADTTLPWNRMPNQVEAPAFRWLDAKGMPNDTYKEIRASAILSIKAGEQLFAGASDSYAEVLKKASAGALHSFALPASVRMHAVSKHREVPSPNVVGILRGSDPALSQEYVIYSAHTDHMGIGRPINGDTIYNGAVDDASGVSALIELARAFSGLKKRPARSILFLATTAEEQGLLGADYFARFPTVPARSIVADFNMDGASVFYTFKDVIGDEHSTLGDTIDREAKKLGLEVSPDPMPEQNDFVRADHYSFVRQGIPAVTISEGLQAKDASVDGRKFVENWIATRYHAPSDDMNQPLNFDASIQYLQLNLLVGYEVAQERKRPAWKQGDFFGSLFGHAP
jgi:Zn-dependent M28 family amino/carboxypeptidase